MDELVWPSDANVPNLAALKSATTAWWKANASKLPSAHRVDKAEVVAVAITGDWVRGASNVLDETTRWDVPAWVALTNAELRAQGLAMVYGVQMVTREERGVKRALPFYDAVIGAPSPMKLAKIPGAK